MYFWFIDAQGTQALPFRPGDRRAIYDALVALSQLRPDETNGLVTGGLPQQISVPAPSTPEGVTFHTVPIMNSAPDSLLYSTYGFEVALAYTTFHSPTEEWHNLEARIADKDEPENDWLFITAGAPDATGFTYPAEELLALFLRDNFRMTYQPKHLKRILIHLWGRGEAFEIWPELNQVFPPLYRSTHAGFRLLDPGEELEGSSE